MKKNQNCVKLTVSLRDLADLGSSVDLEGTDTEVEPAGIGIEQAGGIHDSRIFELPSGLIGYMAYVVVTNQTSRTIYCRDVELRVFWVDSLFHWMPDPRETRGSDVYRFPDRGSPEFPRGRVINHVLLEGGALPPKRPQEGWLLATGRPMPESLCDRQVLDATLAIFASNRIEYTDTIRLSVERFQVKPKRARRKTDLYGKPIGYDIGSPVAARDHQPVAVGGSETKPATTPVLK